MKRVRLVFGTHNALPVGDYDFVFERVYQRAYKPFLTAVNRFPDFPVALHYSGVLLEWFERNHPEILILLGDMVKRRQLELLTGGYYEPLLPLIPHPDRLGQIEKLTTFVRSRFGRRPRGGWLAERVWDPSLVSALTNSGIEYTFLGEGHFRAAGVESAELCCAALTEDQGRPLTVFPLCDALSQKLASDSPEDVVSAIARQADPSGERVVVLIEDGERLGDHEGSYQVCYEERWLERFFEALQAKRDVIEPVTPSQHLRDVVPRRRLYFASTSYAQLMSWDGRRRSDSGPLFRHFLARYPESSLLYARMLYTHLLVGQIRGDKYRKRAASEELWKGQCANVYWHSRQGGIYSSHLRKRAYQAFIDAEKLTRDNGLFLPSINSLDFDLDGQKEYLFHGANIDAYVHSVGGAIFEFDFVPSSWNYGDGLSRQREDYHRDEDKIFDAYPKRIFVDHLLGPKTTLESFRNAEHQELGDFATAVYEMRDLDRENRELELSREAPADGSSLRITKLYRFKKSGVQLRYTLENVGEKKLDLRFGSEVNLSFASGIAKAVRVTPEGVEGARDLSADGGALNDCGGVELRDLVNNVLLRFRTDRPADFWCLPVESVHRSCQAWEREYQSTCLLPRWSVKLDPGASWKVELSLTAARL
jgi:4-alpha-glucanotransferase